MGPVVAVVGSGYMGGGIAQVLALAGFEVRIADVTAEIAEANRERLIAESARFEAQGLFPANSTDVITGQLFAMTLADAVGEAEFIEEAVSETLEIKNRRWRPSRPQRRPRPSSPRTPPPSASPCWPKRCRIPSASLARTSRTPPRSSPAWR